MGNGALEYKLQSYIDAVREFENTAGIKQTRKYNRIQTYSGYGYGDSEVPEVINPRYIYAKLGIEESDDFIPGTNITYRDVCFYIDRRQAMSVIYYSQLISFDWYYDRKIRFNETRVFSFLFIVCFIVFLIGCIVSVCRDWNGWGSVFMLTIASFVGAFRIAFSLIVALLLLLLAPLSIPVFYNAIARLRLSKQVRRFESDIKMRTCMSYIEKAAGTTIRNVLKNSF